MTGQATIYLDNAATTRTAREVAEAMEPYFAERFGNAASVHYETGRQAKAALEAAREGVASLIGAAPEEIYFTSGATEADNWVIQATAIAGKKKHIVTSAIEHHAVLEPLAWLKKHGLCDYTVLPVDKTGVVAPENLQAAIRPDTGLVTIMHANNEIGTLQDISALASVAAAAGVPFHTDATQSVGKIDVDVQRLGVAALSLSAHKFHGPKGIGALYLRKGVRLAPFLHGGGQEAGRRAGTANVAGAVGLAAAARIAPGFIADGARQRGLVEDLWKGLSAGIPKIHRNGSSGGSGGAAGCVPNILSVCIEGAEGEAILGYLDMSGVQASSGSACTSGSLEPSHVLLACGVPVELAHGSVRFSLSHETTPAEIASAIDATRRAVERLRAMSVTWKG